MDSKKCVFGLFGPTASGKSAVAEKLAKTGKFRVINADSRQIYAHLDILSAIGKIPAGHVLYAEFSPDNKINAAQWIDYALQEIRLAHIDGMMPILVGGTGMYFWFFQNGCAQVPEITTETLQKLEQYSFAEQKAMLPDFITQKFQDPMRIKRALGIYLQTGKHITEFFAKQVTFHDYDVKFFALNIAKDHLWSNIQHRTDAMFPNVLDEVRSFQEMHPNVISDAIGFREICEFLEKSKHDTSKTNQLKQEIVFKTRQYSKRQRTYMNKLKFAAVNDNADDLFDRILALL